MNNKAPSQPVNVIIEAARQLLVQAQETQTRASSATLQALADSEAAIEALERDNQQLRATEPFAGLNLPAMRDALVGAATAGNQDWVPAMMGTHGSGPWLLDEFDGFLFERAFTLWEMPDADLDGLIVGQHDWSESALAEQVYARDGAPLRIYTQELFVLGLVLGNDPLTTLPPDTLQLIAAQHPAIQFLQAQNFPWPNVGPTDDTTESVTPWADEEPLQPNSPLSLLGYSVAEGKLTAGARHQLLKTAFERMHLPSMDNDTARARWGVAHSGQRLYAISRHLSWLANFQGPDKPAARQKWLEDLDWLKQRFYKRSQGFSWPKLEATASTRKRVPNAAFMRPVTPSAELAAIVGVRPLPRTEVTKKIWQYIKDHGLQDQENSRMINADHRLKKLFGSNQVSMFAMTKLINQHLS